MKKEIILISRGPQFRNGKAALLFFLNMFLIILLVMSLIDLMLITTFILLPIIAALSIYILDIQGVIIDKENNQIKDYTLQIWGRVGKWGKYSGYHQLNLKFETYVIRNYTFYTRLTAPGGKGISYDNDGRYIIVLEHSDSRKNIILHESDNYNTELLKTRKLAIKLGLSYHDSIKRKTFKPRRKN